VTGEEGVMLGRGRAGRYCVLLALGMAVVTLLGSGAVARAGELAPGGRKVAVGAGRSYTNVSPAALARLLERKSFPLINVHIPYAGEILRTDLFIPFDQVEAHARKLPADKSARLVVYCLSGPMSDIAARTLVKLGYTDVWNLDGGIVAWTEAGYPLQRKGR